MTQKSVLDNKKNDKIFHMFLGGGQPTYGKFHNVSSFLFLKTSSIPKQPYVFIVPLQTPLPRSKFQNLTKTHFFWTPCSFFSSDKIIYCYSWISKSLILITMHRKIYSIDRALFFIYIITYFTLLRTISKPSSILI